MHRTVPVVIGLAVTAAIFLLLDLGRSDDVAAPRHDPATPADIEKQQVPSLTIQPSTEPLPDGSTGAMAPGESPIQTPDEERISFTTRRKTRTN